MKPLTSDKPETKNKSEMIESIVRNNTRLKQDILKIHEEHQQILEMKNVVKNVLDTATDTEIKKDLDRIV